MIKTTVKKECNKGNDNNNNNNNSA